MIKNKLRNFLNKEIKDFKIRKKSKNNFFFIFLNFIYIYLAILMLFSSNSQQRFEFLKIDNFRAIAAQLQIAFLFYLTLKYEKRGFRLALILNIFSFSSLLAVMIINSSLDFISGIFAHLTALIIIILIYNYQAEIKKKISELEKEKEKIHHMAYYDNLTEIANREMLIKRLDHLTSIPDEQGINFSLIFIDFKNFKRINDSLGYKTGDFILRQCALRLKEIINENDFAGRLGGDEFAVIVQREIEAKELKKYIRTIKRELEKPYHYQGKEISLNSNFGISRFPADGKNSKEIIKCSDLAMYEAKNDCEQEIKFFAKNMEKDIIIDMQMEEALKKAIKNDEFHLLFQPQYKTTAKEIRGFEALIRWHSTEIGIISPGRFIPVAEQSGLIKEIGEWVIKNAVNKFKKIEDQFVETPVLSINISVVQLSDPDFVENIEKIIKEVDISGFKLEFEITESLFISDQEYVIDVLYKLKDLGISIAMDDFGTGYASLSYLQHIPLDILKLDKAFIEKIGYINNGEKMMVPSIIEMAHQWGIKVVAEGVETIDQLHYLEDNKCDYLQGFLLNKPLSEYQITKVF